VYRMAGGRGGSTVVVRAIRVPGRQRTSTLVARAATSAGHDTRGWSSTAPGYVKIRKTFLSTPPFRHFELPASRLRENGRCSDKKKTSIDPCIRLYVGHGTNERPAGNTKTVPTAVCITVRSVLDGAVFDVRAAPYRAGQSLTSSVTRLNGIIVVGTRRRLNVTRSRRN